MAADKICKVNRDLNKNTFFFFFTKSHSKCMCETFAVIMEFNIIRYNETNHGQCSKFSEDVSAEKLKQLEAILAEATFYHSFLST